VWDSALSRLDGTVSKDGILPTNELQECRTLEALPATLVECVHKAAYIHQILVDNVQFTNHLSVRSLLDEMPYQTERVFIISLVISSPFMLFPTI